MGIGFTGGHIVMLRVQNAGNKFLKLEEIK